MDDTQNILAQVKVLLTTTPQKDQAQVFEQVERESDNIPISITPTTAKPFITEAKQLSDPKIYQQFEDLAREFIVTDNEEQALKARQFLEDILLPQNKNLKTQQPKLYEGYQKILALFKYVCLPIRSLNEVDFLVRAYFLFALKSGVDIEDKFDKVLFANDDILNDANVALRLSIDMVASTELLGKAELQISYENKTAKPILGNWVKDYLSFSAGSQNRGAFQRISYIRQNKNALSLDPEEKDLLFQALKIYDWLEFGNYESGDGNDASEAPSQSYVNKQTFQLPDEALQPTAIKQAPTIPAPKNAPALKAMSDIGGRSAGGAEVKENAFPSSSNKEAIKKGNNTGNLGGRPVNIEEILKKRGDGFQPGLKMGEGSSGGNSDYKNNNKDKNNGVKPLTQVAKQPMPLNSQSKPSFAKATEGRQAEIDKKLEELEKRIKS